MTLAFFAGFFATGLTLPAFDGYIEAESDAIRKIAAILGVDNPTQIEAGCIGKVIDILYQRKPSEMLLYMDSIEIARIQL